MIVSYPNKSYRLLNVSLKTHIQRRIWSRGMTMMCKVWFTYVSVHSKNLKIGALFVFLVYENTRHNSNIYLDMLLNLKRFDVV